MSTGAATGGSAEQSQIPPPDLSAAATERSRDWSDLGARIASAAILAPAGVAAAWFGGPWMAAACGAAVVAMSYEWARMSEPKAVTPAFLFCLAGSLGAVMFASWRMLDWGMGWLALCGALSAVRRRSFAGVIETMGGVLYIGAPPAIFVWLRYFGDEGLRIVLALFVIIWSADVFAYFGGKIIGGPKVAEGLSPKKTWSGICTGALAGAAAGFGCGVFFGVADVLRYVWIGIGAGIAFTGLMGDLFESFLKRRFGVKDASRIIPGHGGVLDRIDGLMAATLLIGAILTAMPRLAVLMTEPSP